MYCNIFKIYNHQIRLVTFKILINDFLILNSRLTNNLISKYFYMPEILP